MRESPSGALFSKNSLLNSLLAGNLRWRRVRSRLHVCALWAFAIGRSPRDHPGKTLTLRDSLARGGAAKAPQQDKVDPRAKKAEPGSKQSRVIATTERPALQRLLADVRSRKVDVIVVYKVDRLTRSLADFAKLVELFDHHGVSFVSVTQQFNTTTSMGRLTLNVLLSFAQFEREVTSERIRDKISASKRKGLWVGGIAPLGYETKDRGAMMRLLFVILSC